MINFVVRDEKKDQSTEKAKQLTVKITSLVLGLYIIAMGGFLGWDIYWNRQEKKTSDEEIYLRKEIKNLAESEILAIKLADRSTEVNKFLASRGKAETEAGLVEKEGYRLIEWSYTLGGSKTILIAGDSPTHLKEYENYIREKYTFVQTEEVAFEPENGWTEELLVSGVKQQ